MVSGGWKKKGQERKGLSMPVSRRPDAETKGVGVVRKRGCRVERCCGGVRKKKPSGFLPLGVGVTMGSGGARLWHVGTKGEGGGAGGMEPEIVQAGGVKI